MSTPITTQGLLTAFGPLSTGAAVKAPATNLANRIVAYLWNLGQTTLYYGYASGVTPTTGIPVAPGDRSKMLPTSAQIYICCDVAGVSGLVEELA